MSYNHAERVQEVFKRRIHALNLRGLVKLNEYAEAILSGTAAELFFHDRETEELRHPERSGQVQAQPRSKPDLPVYRPNPHPSGTAAYRAHRDAYPPGVQGAALPKRSAEHPHD